MIDSLLGILSVGLLFEVPSGIAPGPVLVLIISETFLASTLAQKWLVFHYRSCSPKSQKLTDAPVVLASWKFYWVRFHWLDQFFCFIWVPKISESPTQKYRII
jgi:hypothetical protein